MADIDKKNEILQAASKVFAHYGYDKATLDDIGKIIGLNKTSLYYYYKNKESIFIDVIKSETNEFLSGVMDKIKNIEGCKNKILKYLSELFKYSEKTINLNKLSIEKIQSIRPIFNELCEDILKQQINCITNILEQGLKNGEIKACDSKKVASCIVTVSQAIKNKDSSYKDYNLTADIDFSMAENEVIYIVSLMIDGIVKNAKDK